MHLKDRLNRIEEKLNIRSASCACSRELVTDVILPDLTTTDAEREVRWQEATKPQFCEVCRKEIQVKHVRVEYVDWPDEINMDE